MKEQHKHGLGNSEIIDRAKEKFKYKEKVILEMKNKLVEIKR